MTLWVVALIVLVAAMLGISWWGAGIILHPPEMSPLWVFPEQFGLRYERFSCRTHDGIELKGWFIPSPTGDARTLLMCHGWGDNKGELLKQTYFLNETAGFNLVYFDFRSHGESEGEITTIGGLESSDFDAVIAWLRANKPACLDRFGVFGLSMGAAVTCAAMPNHPALRCAVLESPFSRYEDVVRRWAWNNLRVPYFPLIILVLRILRLRVGNPMIDAFNPAEAVCRIAPRPLLIIGGCDDILMPEEDVRRVFEAAGEPKQLWMIPGAAHTKCREIAGLEYDTRVSSFFSRHL